MDLRPTDSWGWGSLREWPLLYTLSLAEYPLASSPFFLYEKFKPKAHPSKSPWNRGVERGAAKRSQALESLPKNGDLERKSLPRRVVGLVNACLPSWSMSFL
jgi:hypothetical protein